MNTDLLKSYNFYGCYQAADIVKKILHNDPIQALGEIEEVIDQLDSEEIICLAKFSKQTILHKFVFHCIQKWFSYKVLYFQENQYFFVEDYEKISNLLTQYRINHKKLKHIDKYSESVSGEIENKIILNWISQNEKALDTLWLTISEETFHILFRDRLALQCLNMTIASYINDWDILKEYKTEKGYFKRCNIPKWLQRAVIHRDQARCVFCNKDLTGRHNTLTTKNFDHMVPLSCNGMNDPTNIQLSCDECNVKKSNRNNDTSNLYAKWW